MISTEQYTEALIVVKQYREERGLEFYIPINISAEGNITVEELRLFLQLQNLTHNGK